MPGCMPEATASRLVLSRRSRQGEKAVAATSAPGGQYPRVGQLRFRLLARMNRFAGARVQGGDGCERKDRTDAQRTSQGRGSFGGRDPEAR
jgi:hypothetical protein